MTVYNQYNQIASDRWNVWTYKGRWGFFENDIVADRRDKSDVNETADQ